MKKKKISEEEIVEMMKAYTFIYVDDINEACSPYLKVDIVKVSYYSGFKICKVGRNYFIEVTDESKKEKALWYAKQLLHDYIKHFDDDERELEELGKLAAREYTHLVYGPKYVEDLKAVKVAASETGYYGIRIEDSLRSFTFDVSDEDISA